MNQEMNKSKNTILVNKAEELATNDVWPYFILPPFFNELNLFRATKPGKIIGGRGCGKTMLLLYLSHDSQFSKQRYNIEKSDLEHIGLYWRADTQFCRALFKRGISDEDWIDAFTHYTALFLSSEILKALDNIARSHYEQIDQKTLGELSFANLAPFHTEIPATLNGLKSYFKKQLALFQSWVNNTSQMQKPFFLPKEFLDTFIEEIRSNTKFKTANFYVYIDEFENLRDYQQNLINTWLKHSKKPLLFNFAQKRADPNQKTLSDERISPEHDFNVIDMEDHFEGKSFNIFAAEILLYELNNKGVISPDVDWTNLKKISGLESRKAKLYQDKILEYVKTLLPEQSNPEIAISITKDEALRGNLMERLKPYFKDTQQINQFIDENHASAVVISPVILSRGNTLPQLCRELEQHKSGAGKFPNWIDNNLFACILQIYTSLNRYCPVYAGFETFCHLAHGNLRHFIGLCNRALMALEDNESGGFTVPVEKQARAATIASELFVNDIDTAGRYGNKLHTLAGRLGRLFEASQKSKVQSEPERNQFAITKGLEKLTTSQAELLSEAVKWLVLFKAPATKAKNITSPEFEEYQLNPIYCPFFRISYRRKRRLELSNDDLTTISEGNNEQFQNLLVTFAKRWGESADESNLDLFRK